MGSIHNERTAQQTTIAASQPTDSSEPETSPKALGSSRSSSISDPPTPPPQYIEQLGSQKSLQLSAEKAVSTTNFEAHSTVTHQFVVMRRLQIKTGSEQKEQAQIAESSASASTKAKNQSQDDHCDAWCSCQCHARQSLKTAVSANRFVGSLSVASQGISTGKVQCNQHACRRRPHPSLKLTYRPPPWLSNQYLALSVQCRPSYGPEINVKLPRTVGWDSPLWGYAIDGNITAIKDMIVKGIASPWDVNGLGGSPLHVCVS